MMYFNPLNLFLKEIKGKLIVASKNVQIIVSVYTGMWYFLLKRNSITCLQIVCRVCSLYFPFINKSPWWWGRKSTTTGIKSSAVTLCISPLTVTAYFKLLKNWKQCWIEKPKYEKKNIAFSFHVYVSVFGKAQWHITVSINVPTSHSSLLTGINNFFSDNS